MQAGRAIVNIHQVDDASLLRSQNEIEYRIPDYSPCTREPGLALMHSKTTLRITMIPWKMMVVFIFTTIILLSSPSHAAYRIGDAVGILVRTSTSAASTTTTSVIEAYRHQLPRFGLSTRTSFDVRTLIHGPEYLQDANNHKQRNNIVEEEGQQQPQNLRLSISFDDGFHHIPWVDVYNNNNNNDKNHRVLESLVITIIYSSGDGRIHAIVMSNTQLLQQQQQMYQKSLMWNIYGLMNRMLIYKMGYLPCIFVYYLCHCWG
jgi:hypothetical protein